MSVRTMLDQVLAFFPPGTHPLTLVYDPDEVLADERIRSALKERGFRRINEPDPIELRYQVQHARPFTTGNPVVVITAEPLNTLPYDLWQQGRHVRLELHRLFPNISYAVLRELTQAQRQWLSQEQAQSGPPLQPLSQKESIDYLLQTLFNIVPRRLSQPAMLEWLEEYHAGGDPMSPLLADYLVGQLSRLPNLVGWPLKEMLKDKEAYQSFVESNLIASVREQRNRMGEERGGYTVNRAAGGRDENTHTKQFSEGLLRLEQALRRDDLDWKGWQSVAKEWAELSITRNGGDLHHDSDQLQRYAEIQTTLDEKFYQWLRGAYTPLATRSLPEPHHLYHVPTWLAYHRTQQTDSRVALLILDGMSLADWLQIREVWQTRHEDWELTERLLLSQIPSITAVSRQALVSGRLPTRFGEFGGSIKNNSKEDRGWRDFWSSGQGLPMNSIEYVGLSASLRDSYPDVISSHRTQALCLVSTAIDEMVHGATQGAADVQASLQLWLKKDEHKHQGAVWIEGLIDVLLLRGYMVVLTSDHGHVEATGMSQPQEGSVAETRGKRVRIYGDAATAEHVQAQYSETVLWHNSDVLPNDVWALMPRGRRAFFQAGKRIVGHGGLTIEEIVVPLVTISKK